MLTAKDQSKQAFDWVKDAHWYSQTKSENYCSTDPKNNPWIGKVLRVKNGFTAPRQKGRVISSRYLVSANNANGRSLPGR
jgi:hypothetical protein